MKIRLFCAVFITVLVISAMLFASGCAQKAANETRGAKDVKNLTNESKGIPQEIGNVVEKSDRNIVQTLADENYTTLVKLINVAGLEKILAEGGPFTVFAPTNKAFNALPAATVQALMNNTTELRKVLVYHVAGGELMKKDLVNMTGVQTLEGGVLPINKTAAGLQVGGANITKADTLPSNGVIHQIDKVLIPPQ
jgi:uncharacterized surface protein with fasciclin (FAS1) repeats